MDMKLAEHFSLEEWADKFVQVLTYYLCKNLK